MSLRVWLPLTKDLRNQGLDDITVTNNGATFNANGKLGGCYQFGNGSASSNGLFLNSNLVDVMQEEYSVAVWVKPLGNHYHYNGTIFSSGDWNKTRYSFGLSQDNSQVDILCKGHNNYLTCAVPINTWTHLICTCDSNNIVRLYKNGEYINSSARNDKPDSDNANQAAIGRETYANGYFTFNGMLNDFRLYDHCLSPLEIKHISQGLILHYPLNRGGFGQENFILESHKVTSGGQGSGIIRTYESDGSVKIVSTSGNGNYASLGFAQNSNTSVGNNMVVGDVYCISCDTKIESGTKLPTLFINSGNGYKQLKPVNDSIVIGKWMRVYYTSTWANPGTNYGNISLHLGFGDAIGTYYFKNFKLEKDSIPTPWCPNSSDTLATTLGLNDNVEYDCSGYCNNGEYYAYDTNGSISYTSDTPKYNVSTHIASANPTQNAASGTRYLYGHCELTNPTQMSVAFWLKPITGGYGGTTSSGQGYFCTTNYEYGNISVGTDYQASAMNHRDDTVDMNDSASTTQCRVYFYPTIGEWHHYVYTYDGQVGRGYRDGVQTDTAQFSAAKTLDSFIGVVIGFSKAGGVWRRNDACYSDFRIYATALSAEDVKSLYNNSAYIDNQGNLYGAALREV